MIGGRLGRKGSSTDSKHFLTNGAMRIINKPKKERTPISLEDIRAAQIHVADLAIRTPLVRLNVDNAAAEIYLKLENLQPINSFKIRGAGNAMRLADPEQLAQGVWTASAGNMAQGVAWCARQLGYRCRVVVPDHAPQAKLDAMVRLGAEYVKVPFAEWFEILQTRHFDGMDGYFIHPVSDPHVMAGNGTIGLEIHEDLPDVDVVVIPFGGGGLSCGIASALRALNPDIKIYACEVETASPLAASFREGRAMKIDYQPSFIDGIGSPMVLEEMWPLVQQLLDGSLTVSVDETAKALRLIAERNRVIAEGAGAVSAAVALSGQAGTGKVVCVVSGGNIDTGKLTTILQGKVP